VSLAKQYGFAEKCFDTYCTLDTSLGGFDFKTTYISIGKNLSAPASPSTCLIRPASSISKLHAIHASLIFTALTKDNFAAIQDAYKLIPWCLIIVYLEQFCQINDN
jgi:hypothetical protein